MLTPVELMHVSEGIRYIEFRLTDILGRLKAMIVPCKPVDDIKDLIDSPVMRSGTSIDGSSILGLARVESSDLRLDPDPSTLVELPYRLQRTAAAMCFIREKSETGTSYYPKDTRGILHNACETILEKGMELRAKVEPEFYFIDEDGEPFDYAQYADTYPVSSGMEVLLEIASAIQEMGMEVRVVHHEVGEAQQEIEIDYVDIRKMADMILLFKHTAKAIAQEAEIGITFMPKPFVDLAGSGLHCHLQLWKDGKNLFGDANGISDTAKMFIAGLLDHAPALTALANPTVNSYKRLVPHHEAPVYISWGLMNRTTLIRVPLFTTSQKAAIELRSPDPLANPYLLFAAILAAGMDGIKRALTPIEPVNGDVFRLSDEERKKKGIKNLPANLGEALTHLEEDRVIADAIGKETLDEFIRIKGDEWTKYMNESVTDWEWIVYSDL